jgi:hypothetical protein
MRKPEFPKEIRVGHSLAKIYKTPSHGCDSFTVVWFEGAVRKRKAFASLAKAELHARTKITSLAGGEAEIIQLSGEARLAFIRASHALSEFGLSLDTIACEYRDAKRIAKGRSLVVAAQHYAQDKLRALPTKTVSEVLAEMLKAKRAEGLSDRYVEDLENRLTKFAKDFRTAMTSIDMVMIREWLQALNVANRTRNNFRLAIQTLFSFARSQNYLPKDWREFDSIPVWKVRPEQIEIFSPAEMEILLSVADARLRSSEK